MHNILFYFLLFIIYAFIGWCLEVIYCYYCTGKIINRGFLIGPYCPIYGVGCVLIIILLKRYSSDVLALFIMSIVICSVLEYLTSYILEKLFKTRWWNYSNRKFNINGRICLETMIPFGVGGVIIMKVVNPFIVGLLNKLNDNMLFIVGVVILILFLADNIISFSVVSKIKVSASKLKSDSTEEITEIVKKKLIEHSMFARRLIKSFPNIKILKRNYRKGRKK